jgi:UPF0755 protein
MNVVAPYDLEDDDRDYREGSRWPFILLGGLVAVLLVFGAAFLWVQRQINPPGAVGAPVELRVEKGMSMGDIGTILDKKGVITSATIFKFYVKINGADPVEAGDYTLHKKESMGTVLKILAGGARSSDTPVVLTIPEGLTLKEVAAKVGELPGRSAARFLEVASSGEVRSRYQPEGSTNLEGLMLPETYFLRTTDDEKAILQRMVETFDKTVTDLDIARAAPKLKVTPYQAVIIASLIEREAKVPEDRGPIARVIYNRLAVPMRLQIDATVLYALDKPQDYVLFSDRDINSPYNTYKIDGLPPGPIAGAGKASLEAALSPSPGTWIYYVLIEENGKHAFATTDAEFARYLAEAKRKGLAG